MGRRSAKHETDVYLEFSEAEVDYEVYPPVYGKEDGNPYSQRVATLPEQVDIKAIWVKNGNRRTNILGLLSEGQVIDIEDEIIESRREGI